MTAAPAPSPAEQAVIDRFGIFAEEKRAELRGLRHRPPRWWQFWEPRPAGWRRGDVWPGGMW